MAYADNDGGIQITAKAKLTCTTISSTVATAHTDLQAALRGSTFADGDVIYSIDILQKQNSDSVVIVITWEDQ